MRSRSATRGSTILAGAMLLGACGDPVGPTSARSGNLEATLSVEPEVVSPGDSTFLRAVLINRAAVDTVISFGMGWPYFLRTRPVALRGTDYACVAMGFGLPLAAGDSAVYEGPLHARVGNSLAPVQPQVLTLHSDRGAPMTSATIACE